MHQASENNIILSKSKKSSGETLPVSGQSVRLSFYNTINMINYTLKNITVGDRGMSKTENLLLKRLKLNTGDVKNTAMHITYMLIVMENNILQS